MDSFGIGGAADAERFGDKGANTLRSLMETEDFCAPNLARLGLFHIDGVSERKPFSMPVGAYGRLSEVSEGKDSTIGHWEIAGIHASEPLPTYPNGFPAEVIREIEEMIAQRAAAKKAKNYAEADRIRAELLAKGVTLIDTKDGTTYQIG